MTAQERAKAEQRTAEFIGALVLMQADRIDELKAENAALRARAEQAEARLANTQPYIRRAQELEAERDALRARLDEIQDTLREVMIDRADVENDRTVLRAEAGRLMEVLRTTMIALDAEAYARDHRSEPPSIEDSYEAYRQASHVLSSTPLSVAVVERMRLERAVIEAAQKWRSTSIYNGAAIAELANALAALDRTEKK